MSRVTNVILTFSIMEDSYDLGSLTVYPMMEKINAWLRAQEYGSFSADLDQLAGGLKHLKTPVFIAAFNHFSCEDFVTFLKTLPWEEPECVQVMVKGQEENKFYIIEPFATV